MTKSKLDSPNYPRKIFLTGSSRGLGLEIYSKLSSRGYLMVNPDKQLLDLSDSNSIKDYFELLKEEGFYALILNAGINIPKPIYDYSEKEILDIVNINLTSNLLILKYLLNNHSNKELKHIIIVSSVWGIIGKEYRAVYSATKAGIVGLVRSLAIEFARNKILINSVSPGFINNQMTHKNNNSIELNEIVNSIPLNRLLDQSEVIEVILSFC